MVGAMTIAEVKGTGNGIELGALDESPAGELPKSLSGIRIVIVIGIFDLGGSERQALAVASYLKHVTKADVEVWGCYRGTGRVSELCEQLGIPWRLMPVPWIPTWPRARKTKTLFQYARALRSSHADVLLPFITLTNVFCGLVWRFTGAKTCIWNQRESGITEPISRSIGKRAARYTPWFTSNSEHGAKFLIEQLHVNPAQISLLPNAVSLPKPERDRRSWRDSLGVSEDAFLGIMVANLHQHKDHATLLRAWRIVTSQVPATLLLAGRFDSTEAEVKSLALNLGIEDSVKFLGPVKDVSGLLAACDLGILTSPAEGSPNSLLECMAAGLPVVGSDIPGIREAVGRHGLEHLSPSGDEQALSERILSLLSNPSLRAKLGEQNQQRVTERHTVDALGTRISSVISRAIAPKIT